MDAGFSGDDPAEGAKACEEYAYRYVPAGGGEECLFLTVEGVMRLVETVLASQQPSMMISGSASFLFAIIARSMTARFANASYLEEHEFPALAGGLQQALDDADRAQRAHRSLVRVQAGEFPSGVKGMAPNLETDSIGMAT